MARVPDVVSRRFFSGTPLDTLNQGYSTMIRICPLEKVHYLQRYRKKFIAGLIPAKPHTFYNREYCNQYLELPHTF